MKLRIALLAGLVLIAVGAFASTPDLPSCDVWQIACHYTNASRETDYNINRVVIHKGECATASGGSSWFANCSSGGSAHFFFDKANGYCYQDVYEADVAWHAGNWTTNCNSVGIEHSGWTANNDTSTACYNESAIETKSCKTYYAVPGNRAYIIAHKEVPGCPYSGGGTGCHTDPGNLWNWTYYLNQVNGAPPPVLPTYTNDSPACSSNWATGTSAPDKYGADYRTRPTAAISDQAVWTINVGTAGSYRCQAWWSAGTNRTANTAYVLPDNASVYVNQQANGGKFNVLGTKSLGTGNNTMKLSCWATTGYMAIADAVRLGP